MFNSIVPLFNKTYMKSPLVSRASFIDAILQPLGNTVDDMLNGLLGNQISQVGRPGYKLQMTRMLENRSLFPAKTKSLIFPCISNSWSPTT